MSNYKVEVDGYKNIWITMKRTSLFIYFYNNDLDYANINNMIDQLRGL